MYTSHVCSSSMYIFHSVFNHLLPKNILSSFYIGGCPQLSPIGISNATSNPDPDSSNAPFPSRMTTVSAISESHVEDVNFDASETSEVPAPDIIFAFFSFLVYVQNSEHSLTQHQSSQSSHSPNTELDRSIEVTLQQTTWQVCSLMNKTLEMQQSIPSTRLERNLLLIDNSMLQLMLIKLLKLKP